MKNNWLLVWLVEEEEEEEEERNRDEARLKIKREQGNR
jgi:hypothetical protein